MSKQKLVVFIIAIIGMSATFLPWYEMGNSGMIMGYRTSGWFTFIPVRAARTAKKRYDRGIVIFGFDIFLACRFRGDVAIDCSRVEQGRSPDDCCRKYDGTTDTGPLRCLSGIDRRNMFAVRGIFVQE